MPSSPPVPHPLFAPISPSQLLSETASILSTTASLHDHLATTLTCSTATFSNLIRPLIDDENRSVARLNILSQVLAQLSPDPDVRAAARRAKGWITDARRRALMRSDVAVLVGAVSEREMGQGLPGVDADGGMDDEDRYLLSILQGRFMRSGAGLGSDEDRERLLTLMQELGEICIAAQDTMVEREEGMWFTREELEGVPERILATMVTDDDGNGIGERGRVQVTFRKDHVSAMLRYAERTETRRRFTIANWRRLPENVGRLARAVALRDEIARMLGFEHHAALKMESRMAESAGDVLAHLEKLLARLKPVAMAETQRVLEYKRSISSDRDSDDGDAIFAWDKAYYAHKAKEEISSVNHSPFAEYFEVEHTLEGMLAVFQDLFGMELRRFITPTWHESVISYQVWDTPEEGGDFLGHLYVDLYEREGKYRGAHCIGIQPGFSGQSGTKHYPVTTMFHELGHAIHNLVGRTKYGLSRSRDYSEIPSMMLENWTWIPDVLIRVGRHYTAVEDLSNDRRVLPRELAEAVCAGRNSSRANAVLAHVWPALFDLAIHTPSTHSAALEMDTTEVWNMTKQRVITTSCGANPAEWGAGQARFIHMFRHNDAGYFSYPLSMAYAADLFASAFAKDPMSTDAGRRWRYEVLEPGASRSEMGILKGFLGRVPSVEAILAELNA